ncbi:hypothetical protein N9L50_05620, partial [Flavobacteriaceae bacterium]|nr:hypothetical protein [Flavobacteriaceae bacterium]
RKLAVGGTARVFAKQYLYLKKNKFKEGTDDKVILQDLVLFRHKFPHVEGLLDMIKHGLIKGLKDLIIETLSIEAGYDDNDAETQQMFNEVIEEELLKKGIPKESI